jgi:GNAT superfamily N-acetyltransferase
MHQIEYIEGKAIRAEALLALYNDAGWTNYSQKPQNTIKALERSQFVFSAWNGAQLVGMVRVVGDDYSIVFIQDLLVLTAYQKQGIGSTLLQRTLKKYQSADKVILLADEDPKLRKFYEKQGLKDIQSLDMMSFIKLK